MAGKITERGRLQDQCKTRYFIEIDEEGNRRKFVFGPGYFVEIDEKTGKFDLIDFCAPSLSRKVAPALLEPWPHYEVLSAKPDLVR